MAYPIDKKLVIAVSSSAVFNMVEANNVFETEGEEAYREYQLTHIDNPFAPGVAFPFIRRLLYLNELYPAEVPVEVVVLSRNDPDSGRRFFRSCQHHRLNITRGTFLSGKPPFEYIPAFNASLFLSATNRDVVEAVKAGHPAGQVLPTQASDDENDKELRIAFDFDGVVCDDEAEKVFRQSSLESFQRSEMLNAATPHNPGPLKDLITKISFFQKLEAKKAKASPGYKPALRIAIVTARNAPAHERLVTTLNAWQITAAETFLLGGIEKKRVLDILKPHIFFDDQMGHLTAAASTVPSVHIPFGIANRATSLVSALAKSSPVKN